MKMKVIVGAVLALLTVGFVGHAIYAENKSASTMGSMMQMMSNPGMENMMQMMNNPGMQQMMQAMSTPEGQKMMEDCGNFMSAMAKEPSPQN